MMIAACTCRLCSYLYLRSTAASETNLERFKLDALLELLASSSKGPEKIGSLERAYVLLPAVILNSDPLE